MTQMLRWQTRWLASSRWWQCYWSPERKLLNQAALLISSNSTGNNALALLRCVKPCELSRPSDKTESSWRLKILERAVSISGNSVTVTKDSSRDRQPVRYVIQASHSSIIRERDIYAARTERQTVNLWRPPRHIGLGKHLQESP